MKMRGVTAVDINNTSPYLEAIKQNKFLTVYSDISLVAISLLFKYLHNL